MRPFLVVSLLLSFAFGVRLYLPQFARGAATGPYRLLDRIPHTPADSILLGHPIDLNAADAPLLQTLPGIGPTLAARIVADRVARGPFPRVEALARVHGVGAILVARWRQFITVVTAQLPD